MPPQHPVCALPLRNGFWLTFYRPLFLSDAAPRTIEAYEETLAHWERIHKGLPLAETDTAALARFKEALLHPLLEGGPAMSRATVNKHLRHMGAILGKAGPPGPRNRDALGLLPGVAWVKPCRVARELPRDVEDWTLEAIYLGCKAATQPKNLAGVPAADYWRAVLTTGVCLGFRRGGLLGLRWEFLDWQRREIVLPSEADKCRQARRKPLPAIVLAHLEKIRTSDPHIFPWRLGKSAWYYQWWKIQAAGGLSKPQRIKLHDLKRACGTRLAELASPWVVRQQLDHSSLNTSLYYINATREQREALDKLGAALPAVFRGE